MINDEYEDDFEKQESSKSEETKIYTEQLLNLSVQSSISNTKSSSSTSTRSSISSDIKNKSRENKNIIVVENNDSVNSGSHISLDSLAKRVQNLVGPINLDPPQQQQQQPPTTISIYSQIIQNNGKLPDTVSTTKSKFDYSTIQRDLDTIQTNLKYQRNIQEINKENKEPQKVQQSFKSTTTTNITKKSSYLDFETPKTKLNEKSENYYAKIGRDILQETPMRNNETIFNSQKTLATPMQQQQQYQTRLDTPSTNLSYNTFFGKVHSDYHSSTMCYDRIAQKQRYDEEIDDNNRLSFKKNASTSPIKFQSLSLSDSVAPPVTKYRLNKSPTGRSAFDDDPEVILSRTKQQTVTVDNKKASTQRTLNLYNDAATQDTSGDNTSLFSNSIYNSNQQNFNAFDRVNTKLLTQLRDVVTRSPTYNDYDNSFLQKQVDLQGFKTATTSSTATTTTPYSYSTSALTTVTSTAVVSHRLDSTNNSGPSETYESTHTGSDDARAPKLPLHAYGTRGDEPRGAKGIYERQVGNSVLDAENLRQVDKNLKKLLKKNVDEPKKYENVRERVTAVAWDIDLDGNNNNNNEDVDVDTTNDDEDLIMSHPYLPLRDVPMNNVVKKLQHELELEGEANSRLPKDLNILWQNLQKLKQKSSSSKDDEENLIKLEKLFKNPVETLVDFDLVEQQNKQPIARVQFKEPLPPPPQVAVPVNSASTQTSFVAEPKRAKKSNELNDNTILDVDKQKKLRIQALIRKQKSEHEQRLKTLDKLAKLERLQAEKMKQIMLLNHNDTITSSIMADSYFQPNDTLTSNDDSTLLETDNDSTLNDLVNERIAGLEKLDQKYKKKLQQKQQQQQQQSDKRTSYVQVLNLKNTSVYEPPEGFYVVKERNNQPSPIQQQQPNAVPKVKKQTNELHADKEGRVFVTIPSCGGGGGGSMVTSSNKGNSKSVQNMTNLQQAKSAAWFQPVTLVSETTREPFVSKQQQKRMSSGSNLNNIRASPPIAKQQQQQHRASYPRSPIQYQQHHQQQQQQQQQEKPKGLKKMSLQEAFEMFNFDFISRSRKRLKEVRLRADERRHEEQFKRERIELGIDSDTNYAERRGNIKHQNLMMKHHPLSENLFLAQRRPMTAEQIKLQTSKVYKKLPEVKEKEKRVKNEEERKRNRLKSNIYNRVSFMKNGFGN
jgi:hypothetical protein